MPYRFASWWFNEAGMLAPSLHLISITGAGAIIVTGNSESFAMVGVLITSIGGLIAQIIKNRNDAQREERRHRFDMEEREQTARVRASIDRRLADVKMDLLENTETTKAVAAQVEHARTSVISNVNAVGEAAKTALEAANNVNKKIATIAEIAASGRASNLADTLADTNETAHRIESKL